MGDLLKEAIADAKAVRETALANAKMALEEAFTPQLKSMLSAKLREEEDEFEGEEEVPAEDEIGDEEDIEDVVDDSEEVEVEEESVDASDVDVDAISEDEEVEEELDLESIIRELESELSEDYDEDDDEEAVEESDETEGEEVNEEELDEDEEFEIDESLFEEGDEEYEEEVEESTEVSSIQAELDEYKEAVVFLKDKLHEVNILNAKLLFTNKLFKEFSLDNGQKLKVVETFDRAQTTREIKLVYSTLAEQFGDNGSITRKNNIKESASSAVSSTKPSKESKVITEEEQVADRFRKLAGIING